MVKTNKSLNLALAVLFAALVLYLGFALLRRSQSGYTTAQAVMVTVNETGQAEGVVVREEQVLRSSKTHVAVYVNEGAEVRAGGEVAVESDSEKTLEDAARVRQQSSLCDPMDCSPSCSAVRGIVQARILEWVAVSFSRRSSQHRDQTQFSCIAGKFFIGGKN